MRAYSRTVRALSLLACLALLLSANLPAAAAQNRRTAAVTVAQRATGDAAAAAGVLIGIAAIAAGAVHTCALITGGGVKCWGSNFYGQLGDGSTTTQNMPVGVIGLAGGVRAIAAGGFHTCALTTGGGVKCWGDNKYGQLGDGTTIAQTTPVDVSGLTSGVQAISAGESHTCALTTGGGVKCWGSNQNGELGDGTGIGRLTAVDVSGLTSGVQAVSAGMWQTCAVTTGGAVKCWGRGYLGDGVTIESHTPIDVSGLTSGVRAVSVADGHSCALTEGGGAKCWGSNLQGQLGDGSTTIRTTPVDVSGLTSGVQAVEAGGDHSADYGEHHTCALTAGGGVKCWGDNISGQLGDGSMLERHTPVDVSGLGSGVQAIAAGGYHCCALTIGGGVKCWGSNYSGQLGDGTNIDRHAPVDVVTPAPSLWDGADLAGQSEYPTVKPGASVTLWIDVRNTGTSTWTAADGYRWRGAAQWQGRGGAIAGAVAPGLVWSFTDTIVAPLQPGTYDYGVLLEHNGVDFGPYFFIRVTVQNEAASVEPVVFIPGIGGSRIKGTGDLLDVWPNFLAPDDRLQALLVQTKPPAAGVLAGLEVVARRLTLDPAYPTYDTSLYAVDVIRRAFGDQDTYDSFLRYLASNGPYTEYKLPADARHLPGYGCDTTQNEPKPSLFVFPYDWRRSNAENAVLLKHYIADCVLYYHPDSSVNLVTHSMGGLVARRYILDNRASHHVKRMITMAAPWLGAPKLINVLESGDFAMVVNALLINKRVMKELVRTFPGAHELLPSARYFDKVGANAHTRPLAEAGNDVDKDGDQEEAYDYDNYLTALGLRYGEALPANNSKFHGVQGQDTWGADDMDVEYHHFIGVKYKADTITQVQLARTPHCLPWPVNCVNIDEVKLVYASGDGTVPLVSALSKSEGPRTTDNIAYYRLQSREQSADESVEHGGMVLNQEVQRCIVALLQGNRCASVLKASADANPALEVTAPAYYISVTGAGAGYIVDGAGNATGMLHDGAVYVDQVPNIAFDPLGDDGFAIVAPVGEPYTVTLQSGEMPLVVQIETGIPGTIEAAVRYRDVVVPLGTVLELRLPLTLEGDSGPLLYDSNADGAADTPIVPGVVLQGPAAQDTQAPQVTVAVAPAQGGARKVEVAAVDGESGVKAVYYSTDGSSYLPYEGPLTLGATVETLFAFADDNAGNRSSRVEHLLDSAFALFAFHPQSLGAIPLASDRGLLEVGVLPGSVSRCQAPLRAGFFFKLYPLLRRPYRRSTYSCLISQASGPPAVTISCQGLSWSSMPAITRLPWWS